METNYALKREKTIWLKWLLVAFLSFGFLSHSLAENMWYQKANDPVKVSVTTAVTLTICSEDPATIGVQNTVTGVQYRLKRNGAIIGFFVGTGATYQAFGSYNTPGLYTSEKNTGSGWTVVSGSIQLANYFVLPDTSKVLHAGNPANPRFYEHYICEWYTNPVYTVDSANINAALVANGSAGIAPQGITWITTGWDTACNTFNLSTTGQGSSQIKIFWFEAVRGRVRAQIETVEGCIFYTPWKYVYIFLEAGNSYVLIDPVSQDTLPAEVHYCGEAQSTTVALSGSDRYEVCVPSGVGFPTPIDPLDGYWYFLYEFGQKVDSVIPDFPGQQIQFEIGNNVFDTIFYSIFAYPVHHDVDQQLTQQPLPYCGEFITSILVIRDYEPMAYAGEDQTVCDEACVTLEGNTGVPLIYRHEDFNYWWTYSGPGTLTFNPSANDSTTQVCVDECGATSPFGTYTLWFNVSNHFCFDSDDVEVTFLEKPTAAVANDDLQLCDQACFTIEALPYSYCGTFGTNFDDTDSHWEWVSGPQFVSFADPSLASQYICLTGDCYYGTYTFMWVEVNSLDGITFCTDTTYAYVTIDEDPFDVYAGPDESICEDAGNMYTLSGTGHVYCGETAAPGAMGTYMWTQDENNPCLVTFGNPEMLETGITFSGDCCFGEFTFYLTETNGNCSETDTVVISRYETPETSAGADFSLCGDENGMMTTLMGTGSAYCNDFTDVTFLWTADATNPCAVEIAADDQPITDVYFTDQCACPWGMYTFYLTETNGACEDTDTVVVTRYEPATTVDAGTNGSLCGDGEIGLEYFLEGTGHMYCTSDGSTDVSFLWTAAPTNPCEVTFGQDAAVSTPVFFTDAGCCYGLYTFYLTETNGDCSVTDFVEVTRYEPPVDVYAGDDAALCQTDGSTYTLTGTGHMYCTADGTEMPVFAWTALEGNPCTVDFTTPDMLTTDITFVGDCCFGVFGFVLTETNGDCEETDTVYITRYEKPIIEAVATNGPSFCGDPNGDTYSQLCVEEGEYCNPDALPVYLWEQDATNPCTVTFSDDAAACTDVAFSDEFGPCCPYGLYTFYVTVTNGECSSTDVVTITRFEPPAEDISAGEDAEVCDVACYSLVATPSAEYCQDASTLEVSYLWTVADFLNPGTVTFTDPTSAETDVCFDEATCAYGPYTFRFIETNGDCEVYADVTITRYEQPTADAGPDECVCIEDAMSTYFSTVQLAAVPFDFCYTYDNCSKWTKSDGPGDVVFDDITAPDATVTFSVYGCYTFTWNECNPACEASDDMVVCWLEDPIAGSEQEFDEADCGSMTYDMTNMGIIKYIYAPAPNVSWDNAMWSQVDGPGTATFDDPSSHTSMVTVDAWGCYTFKWTESNSSPYSPCADADACEDFVLVEVCFYEDPIADAGEGGEVCGTMFELAAIPYVYAAAPSLTADNQTYFWEVVGGGDCATLADDASPVTELSISNCDQCYTTYTLVWHEVNGNCEDTDTVYVTFGEEPPATPLLYNGMESNCDMFNYPARNGIGPNCIMPGDTLEACAFTCWNFSIPMYQGETCSGYYFDDCGVLIPYLREGWTYEWSVIGPNGTTFNATPGYFDFGTQTWHYPNLEVCWGECCEIGTIYLTITTPFCTVTYPYYFQINHLPDATIAGPDVAEVSSLYAYSVPENDCALYNWRVEFCGEIVSGQGTNEIVVHWTDYAENGGVGIVEVQILDTCTGCCGEGDFMVDIYPTGSFGDGTLYGHVTYDNAASTPLNGVHLMLYNGTVMIGETWSFNDIDGDNGPGYFEFSGINETTTFQLVAEYNAPWFGANATDALAIQLEVATLPGITWDALNTEAGNVNSASGLTSTDALWVMQRAIYMVNFFPAGDWVFGDATTTDMMVNAGPYDISALNYGDVNRSNTPTGMKESTAITLVKDGVLNVTKGEEFTLPIRVADAIELGAVTLHATVNSELVEIVDVTGFEGALRSTADNRFSVAWSSTNAINLSDDDAVITVKAIALDDISSDADLFTIELGTEFAYANAEVVEDLTLKTFGVTTEIAPNEYALGYNRPNPFSSTTEITYALPETGKVRLSVMNVYGTEIAVIAEGTQFAGTYTVTFSSAGMNAGVYLYKLIVDGETSDFVETRRMVISH